jgi:cytochrome c-type biogenesis protein CcmF
VRSGVLTSVHSFATDPRRGVFILVLLSTFTGGSLILYAFRAPTLKAGGLFAPISREGALLFNNVVLSTAAGTVLLGTLYPLFADAFGLGKVSVGPPYFNIVIGPLMVLLIVVMAIGPLLSWKRGNLREALNRLRFAFIVAIIAAASTWALAGNSSGTLFACTGLGLAAWLLVGTLTEWAWRVRLFQSPLADSYQRALRLPRSAYGMTIAHMGMAVLLIGIVGSVAWKTEVLRVMRPGDSVSVAGYDVAFLGADNDIRGPNYRAERANFIVTKNGHYVTELQPERRMYFNPPQPLSTVAIHTNFVNDLYVVLGDPDGTGGQLVHIFHNPLIPWLFFGAIMMVMGGVVSLTDRRHRVGAPLRRIVQRPGPPSVALAATGPIAPTPALQHSRSWSYIVPLLVFVGLVGVFFYRLQLAANGITPNLIPSVLINKPAPGFNLPSLFAGQAGFKTSDFRGRVTVVNFFASWCVPCREEHPMLSRIPATGITLIGINYRDEPDERQGMADRARQPLQDGRGRCERADGNRFWRVWRAGDLSCRHPRRDPLQADRPSHAGGHRQTA